MVTTGLGGYGLAGGICGVSGGTLQDILGTTLQCTVAFLEDEKKSSAASYRVYEP